MTYMPRAAIDARYVNITGNETMTGPLVVEDYVGVVETGKGAFQLIPQPGFEENVRVQAFDGNLRTVYAAGVIVQNEPMDVNHLTRKDYVDTALPRHSGWRNVSDQLINGFGGNVFVMRSGWHVTLVVNAVTRAASVPPAGAALLSAAPAGFKPAWPTDTTLTLTNLYDAYQAAIVSGSWVHVTASASYWVFGANYPANFRTYFTMTYPTGDVWPTTLPGVPG